MKTKAKFPGSSSKNCFYSDVRQKVNLHFSSNNIGTHANAAMWFKTILFLTTGLIIYLIILLVPLNLSLLAVLVISLGACCAFIGFNICHDAIHGSFSKHKEVNKMFSFVFNLVGANPYVWNITHNIVHHTYTNIPGHDEDIEVAPGLIRISENDELKKYQRYQQFYAFALYSLASLSWVLRKDYKKFFQSHVGMHENKHPPKEYFKLFFYKALYYFLFIGLPILIMSVAW
ncbi:MAG: acyl-CoA desaturase, partial [Pedobacter sp.]